MNLRMSFQKKLGGRGPAQWEPLSFPKDFTKGNIYIITN